ncbi:MAG: HAD family hydrolase [Myxococcales bacterium]|nr:MAG: HAD family hydrolase [Myxococcales bacterium]
MTRRLRGVIWDIDGTLINSNDAHARSWVDALSEAGVDVSFAQVRPLIGMGGDKLLPRLAGVEDDSPLGQRVSQRRAQIFKEQYLPSIRPFPKTRELLLRLKEWGLALAVASSAKGEELAGFLDIAHVRDLIEQSTSSSDAERSKPDPDIVQVALQKLGYQPRDVIMVGDTPYDVEAASQLGVGAIALRSGGRSDADLAGALAIYDHTADLLERLESSPLSPRNNG